jgi:hypothetical protein
MEGAWPWIVLALLGAYHGLNPAMGWLFAVALGMQERRRSAVVRALWPIALGHELAIVLVAVLVLGLGLLADSSALHLGAGIALIAFGVFRFVKPRAHPRWTTMRVNRAELTWWSFLMSSAHGAGLMVAPVLIGAGAAEAEAGSRDHALDAVRSGAMSVPESALGIALHVGAMIAVMGVIAVVVYEHVGVAVLRKAWINLDGVWAAAFVLAGLLTLFT